VNTLFRNVLVFASDAESGMAGPADVLITGERIAAVNVGGQGAAPDDTRIVNGSGKLLLPGLINGHFHSSVNHMKGRLPSLPLEIFMLYESPALEALMPTPREAYVRTQLACAEMLRGGVTSVQDDAFFVPRPTPEIVDAVMQAYLDAGIRATVALDEPNVAELDKLPFIADLLPASMRAELTAPRVFGAPDLLGIYNHLITRWHGAGRDRLRAAVSCSAPQRVSLDYFHALDELSRAHDLPFYAHMLETKLQRVFGEERLGGRSLICHVADLGLLSSRMNIIHAIWVDDHDLDLIAESGAVVAHNPISNLRLGSGIMPFRRIASRGIPICLGTDEAIADDAVNMWSVAKMTGLIHNLTGSDYHQWPRADEVLRCLFEGGARAMGRGDLGAIEVGRLADLVLLDLDTLPFTPLNDLRRQLVYCENGGSVVVTMVAGAIVFESGTLLTIDESALRAEAREIFAARQATLTEAATEAERWLPYYDAMYARACARDVSMNRRIADAGPSH
jgi:5-methylthioadenosine/S-adenosylhomocysteine deaminase